MSSDINFAKARRVVLVNGQQFIPRVVSDEAEISTHDEGVFIMMVNETYVFVPWHSISFILFEE